MPDSFILPALGESVTEGTVTRWFKAVGDTVAIDEPLVEVSTDKVDTEIPSPFAGTLLSILVGVDQMAEIGSILAVIGTSVVEPVETPVVETPAVEPVGKPADGSPADRSSLSGSPEREGPAASLRAVGALGDFPANRPQAASASLTPLSETPAPPVVEPGARLGSETGFRQAQSPVAESGYVTPMVRK
ncbi:MAG: biotin/lipoyl-containing protein, partial [Specibacter sp.]